MFKVNDIVCHKASFLKSIGWITDVPKNGKVVEVKLGEPQRVMVEWCDGDTVTILCSNLVLESKKHLEPV